MLINQKKSAIPLATSEGQFREPITEKRRLIYGGDSSTWLTVEFYDFFADHPIDWVSISHELKLQVCINLEGTATFYVNGSSRVLRANECAIFATSGNRLKAIRSGNQKHCFYALQFSLQWLQHSFHQSIGQSRPAIRGLLSQPERTLPFVECLPLPFPLLPIRKEFLAPPVPQEGAEMWYQGKAIEVLAHLVYLPAKAMSGSERRNQARVEKARAMIERSVADPPSLETIAQEVGCSMSHLSRTFKEALGVNLSDYQRAVSMDAATVYLREGMSVNDTANAVGYRSASAFINVFQKHHQMTPTQWVNAWKKRLQEKPLPDERVFDKSNAIL